MNNYHKELIPDDRHPIIQLLILICLVLLGMGFGISAGTMFLEIQGKSVSDLASNWWDTMIIQGFISLLMFTVASIVYIKYFEKIEISRFFKSYEGFGIAIVLCCITTFFFMVFNTVVIEWNQNLTLPDFLGGIKEFLEREHESRETLTKFLTQFSGTGQLILTMIVIAVLPAVGEELLFRGNIQPILHRAFGNPHIAIWLTGLLFGAFHFQFYGTFPRALLGVVFGYMFYYSGNLLYPMIGHFINNGLSIILLYMVNNQIIKQDIEEVESVPFYQQLIFLVLFIFAMMAFIRHFNPKTQSDG